MQDITKHNNTRDNNSIQNNKYIIPQYTTIHNNAIHYKTQQDNNTEETIIHYNTQQSKTQHCIAVYCVVYAL